MHKKSTSVLQRCLILLSRNEAYAFVVSCNKTALFLANWSVVDCLERLPNSMLVANFKFFTSNFAKVLFLLSFLFNLVTAMISNFMFLI